MKIEDEIQRYIREDLMHRGSEDRPLTHETLLFREHVLDSFGLLALATFIEERFGLTVQDDDMVPENFGTIGSIADFVRSRAAASRVS